MFSPHNIRELNRELYTGLSTLYTTDHGPCSTTLAYPK